MENTSIKILPNHIAIICDGNRRWAKSRKLPTFIGHTAGLKNIKKLVDHIKNKGIKVVTLYAFSTENWKRTKEEVSYLMKIFISFLKLNSSQIIKNNVKFIVLGDVDRLHIKLKDSLVKLQDTTKNNDGFTIQIAINYGARDEIVRAIRKISDKVHILKNLTSEKFEKFLDTAGVPDPDLVIRTSGEQRLSNFLLWQSAYSEIYFAPEMLPDFNINKLDSVLDWFNDRKRRFGQ